MRARKPWVRARRIFEGWNVRFMMAARNEAFGERGGKAFGERGGKAFD
jgi:hypothetical protein